MPNDAWVATNLARNKTLSLITVCPATLQVRFSAHSYQFSDVLPAISSASSLFSPHYSLLFPKTDSFSPNMTSQKRRAFASCAPCAAAGFTGLAAAHNASECPQTVLQHLNEDFEDIVEVKSTK